MVLHTEFGDADGKEFSDDLAFPPLSFLLLENFGFRTKLGNLLFMILICTSSSSGRDVLCQYRHEREKF